MASLPGALLASLRPVASGIIADVTSEQRRGKVAMLSGAMEHPGAPWGHGWGGTAWDIATHLGPGLWCRAALYQLRTDGLGLRSGPSEARQHSKAARLQWVALVQLEAGGLIGTPLSTQKVFGWQVGTHSRFQRRCLRHRCYGNTSEGGRHLVHTGRVGAWHSLELVLCPFWLASLLQGPQVATW